MPEPASLFAAIEPFHTAFLDVGDGHRIRYEQCGNPKGIPVLFVHGGPASGYAPRQRQFFDPAKYHIILFDQRGSGASTPHGERANNTTQHLISDMESLRQEVGVDQWLLFGGSWGSSLAMAFAGCYPQRCLGLILRGVFLTGVADMNWFFRDAGALLPDAWASFAVAVALEPAASGSAENLLQAYTTALDDPQRAAPACASWMAWEASLTRPGGQPHKPVAPSQVSAATIAKYRLQAAYLNRLCDLGEASMIEAAQRAASLPVAIVHGRLDWVCRPANAWKIHQIVPGSRLRLIDHAGHDPYSSQMVSALIDATNCFARHRQFAQLDAQWVG